MARIAQPPVQRVLAKSVAGPGGCVLYMGRRCRDGYGVLAGANGRSTARAHRISYEYFVGAIPAGKQLDHLCHTEDTSCDGGPTCIHRRCVNPHHLEPVTPAENNARGRSASARNRLKTHCPQGHPYDEQNTNWHKNKRHCRACGRQRRATQRQQQRADQEAGRTAPEWARHLARALNSATEAGITYRIDPNPHVAYDEQAKKWIAASPRQAGTTA